MKAEYFAHRTWPKELAGFRADLEVLEGIS